jgi:DNA-binding HxlR family transcriptional regulator
VSAVGTSYHQFCPVAKAMELLDERWTMLIIREMLSGSTRFNDLRRGLPTMSPTLLSKRLTQLVRAGVVTRHDDGREVSYELSEAGEELRPVVEGLGAWGMRWTGTLGDIDLDPKLLVWDLHRNVDLELVPPGRTVVLFRFSDVPPKVRSWWLILSPEGVDVCDFDPGHETAVSVTGTLRHLVEIWRGDLAWPHAVRSGVVTLQGSQNYRRAVPIWFPPSRFAAVPRPEPVPVP